MTPALLSLAASLALAAGPADLASLKEGSSVGAYSASSLYLDPAGNPKGARFKHPSGLAVDVLFFESVPQVSMYWGSLPSDDRGAPHTLEHLLLGKGRAGRRLNTLMPMRLGDYTAATYSDLTLYQMNSAAGPAEFYELLETYLDALLKPDFTEEESRREVAHVAAVSGPDGALHLEEKGTVYDEMVSRMEKPDSIAWEALGKLVYGPAHPLALNQGGAPAEIWKLANADIRAFHEANYHVGPNMALMAAIPTSWEPADFLDKLDGILRRTEPGAAGAAYRTLPPFSPSAERKIVIGRFPSADPQVPQNAFFAWPPVAPLGRDEIVRAGLALSVAADGSSAFLYRDLVDQKTRKLDAGATGVGSYLTTHPSVDAGFWVTGLPVESITEETLGRLRGVILERLRWLHDLQPGSEGLAEAAAMARSRIRSARRSSLKAMDGPPGFGNRGSGVEWQRALELLAREPGFAKRLDYGDAYDRLLEELEKGANPWTAAIERLGLLEQPYVAAVRPDAGLLKEQKETKEKRLAEETEEIKKRYGLGQAEALKRFSLEYASATAGIEALEKGLPKPGFLKRPPLTLDEVDWDRGRLASGPRVTRTRFSSTPFTDLKLVFDLSGVAESDRELLPLLAAALGEVGVVTKAGERLDYAKAEERVMDQIHGLGVHTQAFPKVRRYELVFSASASSPEEIDRAAAWLGDYLLRPALGSGSRERLVDLVRARLQTLRGLFNQDEEYWIKDAAAAYRWQDQPLYMALESPFTRLSYLNRLRWRLEEPSPAEREAMRSSMTAVGAALRAGAFDVVGDLLGGVGGELGEHLRWEWAHLPKETRQADLGALLAGLEADLGRSARTIDRLKALAAKVLVRAGARVHVNGSRANTSRAEAALDRVLAELPKGAAPARPKKTRESRVLGRLRERLPGIERPVHVALIHDGTKTGSISVAAPGPGYESRAPGEILDMLAYGVLAGGGAHALFIKTWGAGLAYSNGLSVSAAAGRVQYYAERSPDLSQTLKFVSNVAGQTRLDDPFLLEYSLSYAFGDYRAGGDFSSRGAALAEDLEDGHTPHQVRGFKQLLLSVARSAGALARVRGRLADSLGRVLIGYRGGGVGKAKDASAFVVASEEAVARYEAWLKSVGEADRVVRLYPRDFWP